MITFSLSLAASGKDFSTSPEPNHGVPAHSQDPHAVTCGASVFKVVVPSSLRVGEPSKLMAGLQHGHFAAVAGPSQCQYQAYILGVTTAYELPM